MKQLQDIWNKTGPTIQAFSPLYQERMIRLTQEYDPPNFWFILNWVRAADPSPFYPEKMAGIMAPYSAKARILEPLEGLVDAGFLAKAQDGGLTLTESGRGLIEGFFTNAHDALSSAEPLPLNEMKELQSLLRRVVESVTRLPEPADKTYLVNSRWTDPGPEAAPAAQIDQYVTDLYRFRDDAHMSAWKSYGVSGPVWETFTFIWREEAGTADELTERLANRGFESADYQKAIEKLVIKGWVEEVDGKYQVTPKGKSIRQEAEDRTDKLFFAGWSVLSETELTRLDDLITRMNENLKIAGYKETWDQAMGVVRGIIPVTRVAVDELFAENFAEPRFFFPILLATGTEPEPFSIEKYVAMNPYTAPTRLTQNLADIAESGLMADGTGAYRVTKKGHASLKVVNDSFYSYLGQLELLEDEELQEISDFLDRLIKASLEAEEPKAKTTTKIMHHTHPGGEYSLMAKLDMQMDDLRAFRDDAHIASWQPYDLDGRTWETLTFIWQGNAKTAAQLTESLPFRGYQEEDYASSLRELSNRGLIENDENGYVLTAGGETLRLEAEEATDRIFFAPWNTLENNENARLLNLLIRLKINLENLAEKEVEPAGS